MSKKIETTLINKIVSKENTLQLIPHKCKGQLRNCYEQLDDRNQITQKKWINSQKYNLPRLNHEETKRTHQLLERRSNEQSKGDRINGQKSSNNKIPGSSDFTGEFYQMFKEKLVSSFLYFSKKKKNYIYMRREHSKLIL